MTQGRVQVKKHTYMESESCRESMEEELRRLRLLKSEVEHKIQALEERLNTENRKGNADDDNKCGLKAVVQHDMDRDSIYRFSRHLILPSFGVQGQTKLMKSSVLLIGAGGLGSPIALYLASCGIGCLGIIDHDVVEMNNLHRQVIHSEQNIGDSKVKSAAAACHRINSAIKIDEYHDALTTKNALEIVGKYDIIVDATDNLPSRYLINDSCVILGKPLVSGAALGLEGQITIYHHNHGPCYRCLLPTPPPSDACQRCSDNGVLGVVPGIIGCIQALEVIKLSSGVGDPLSGRMLIFDALSTRFQSVKLRGRQMNCSVCGDNPKITYENFKNIDYEGFTSSPMSDKARSSTCLLPASQRVTSKNLHEHIKCGKSYILLDVREEHQYNIVSLPSSINIPLKDLDKQFQRLKEVLKTTSPQSLAEEDHNNEYSQNGGKTMPSEVPLYVICRRGNDSQKAVEYLCSKGLRSVWDIIGGLESWSRDVDPDFPSY